MGHSISIHRNLPPARAACPWLWSACPGMSKFVWGSLGFWAPPLACLHPVLSGVLCALVVPRRYKGATMWHYDI